jgi:hypothetical protein
LTPLKLFFGAFLLLYRLRCLALEVDQFDEHFFGGGDDAVVGLETEGIFS